MTHAEVGLTPSEVSWARANRDDPHICALNLLFRRIEATPLDDGLRQEFAERLRQWRNVRAFIGMSLSGTS